MPRGEGRSIAKTAREAGRPRTWLIVGRKGSRVGQLPVGLRGGAARVLVAVGLRRTRMGLLAASDGCRRIAVARLEGRVAVLVKFCSGAARVVLDPVGRDRDRKAYYPFTKSWEEYGDRLLVPRLEVAVASTRDG